MECHAGLLFTRLDSDWLPFRVFYTSTTTARIRESPLGLSQICFVFFCTANCGRRRRDGKVCGCFQWDASSLTLRLFPSGSSVAAMKVMFHVGHLSILYHFDYYLYVISYKEKIKKTSQWIFILFFLGRREVAKRD